MEKMGTADSELEVFFEEKKRVKNPFVPIGAFLTAGVLTAGLISFKQGNSNLGQKLMRARVVAQGATVALMLIGVDLVETSQTRLASITLDKERRFISGEMSSPSKRRDMDVMKLMMSDYAVETINDGINEFNVEFHGPKESLYEGGVWKVHVELPDAYPYKSPSIGFLNKIYHPNVDELSGSVCLDVINQSWSPMFDLLNVFEVFLPQLLLYPNPSDPLNGDAASLMMKDKKQYEQKVKEYCERYAKKENITSTVSEDSDEEASDEDVSDERIASSDDDDVVGHVDP